MDLIGAFIKVFSKSLPDFKYSQNYRDNCIIFFSKILNQVICIKYSQRKHYIPPSLVHQYLDRSRREMERKLGSDFCNGASILNVFIADNLTDPCFELIEKTNPQNMNMIFCTKHLIGEQIVSTVLDGLRRKLERWHQGIADGVKSKHIEKPYGEVEKKLEQIDLASTMMRWSSYHLHQKILKQREGEKRQTIIK